jgi:hypothetical protein
LQFKIKGNLNGEVKSIQVERGITPDLNEIKNRFERAFGTTGLTLKYRYSDGRFEALYQVLPHFYFKKPFFFHIFMNSLLTTCSPFTWKKHSKMP